MLARGDYRPMLLMSINEKKKNLSVVLGNRI